MHSDSKIAARSSLCFLLPLICGVTFPRSDTHFTLRVAVKSVSDSSSDAVFEVHYLAAVCTTAVLNRTFRS
jgi:hypothetical protein